jgi:hypothetical protein
MEGTVMTVTLPEADSKDVFSLVFKMETPIGEAARFGNALALAIEGVGKTTDMEPEDEIEALRVLAFEVCGAVAKLRKQWNELFEQSKRERA